MGRDTHVCIIAALCSFGRRIDVWFEWHRDGETVKVLSEMESKRSRGVDLMAL